MPMKLCSVHGERACTKDLCTTKIYLDTMMVKPPALKTNLSTLLHYVQVQNLQQNLKLGYVIGTRMVKGLAVIVTMVLNQTGFAFVAVKIGLAVTTS